jgi:hypothetical protein
MAKQLQLRRGTTTQHASFTGLVGEVTVDTDKDIAVIHDGATAGGKPLSPEAGSAAITTLGTVTSGSIAGGTITSATTFPVGHVIKVTVAYPATFAVTSYAGASSPYYSPTTAISMTSGNRMLVTWQGVVYRTTQNSSDHTYMGLTGSGMTSTIQSATRMSLLSNVTHYRWSVDDTYSVGSVTILSDVVNATSGSWGTFMTAGTSSTSASFNISSQVVIFQEIQA